MTAFNVKKNNVISMHSQSRGRSCSSFTDHPAFRKPCLAYFKANICPYYRCLWCNEADKIILSQSLIRGHSLLVCGNSSPLFSSRSCLSFCVPLFHDCLAGHDDISLKARRKGRNHQACSLFSICSLCSNYSLFYDFLPPVSYTTPAYSSFLHTHVHTHTHTRTNFISSLQP